MTDDPPGPSAIVIRRKRALYRAQHRGTKEMDWMLGRYAETKLEQMLDTDLQIFERLLEAPDPEINTWLLSPEHCPDTSLRPLIDQIRTFHALT